jgi:hypothetical protein
MTQKPEGARKTRRSQKMTNKGRNEHKMPLGDPGLQKKLNSKRKHENDK